MSLKKTGVVFPPNSYFQRDLNYSQTAVIHKCLYYLDFNENQEVILGSSSVNSTLWEGSLLYFKNTEDLIHEKFNGCYIGPTSCDGKFLDNNLVAIADDTGDLSILNISDTIELYSYYKHFQRIPQLAVWNKSSKVLTCSGRSILVIDINVSAKPTDEYLNFHTENILSVDTLRSHSNIFLSAGLDQKAILWDEREKEPVSVIYSNEFAALTSVAWHQTNDNNILIGTEAGDIYLVDKRDPNTFVDVNRCLKSSIYRITYGQNNQFAVCSESNEVLVLDCSDTSLNVTYNNKEHDDIVRGLAWSKDGTLYSCGYNKKIVKHLI